MFTGGYDLDSDPWPSEFTQKTGQQNTHNSKGRPPLALEETVGPWAATAGGAGSR